MSTIEEAVQKAMASWRGHVEETTMLADIKAVARKAHTDICDQIAPPTRGPYRCGDGWWCADRTLIERVGHGEQAVELLGQPADTG